MNHSLSVRPLCNFWAILDCCVSEVFLEAPSDLIRVLSQVCCQMYRMETRDRDICDPETLCFETYHVICQSTNYQVYPRSLLLRQTFVVISAEDRVGSVQLALTALSEWKFSWKKKEKKGAEIEPFDFWVIPKIVLQNIHKLAVIFSLKGNDLIFNSVVRIWLVIGV